MSDLNIGPESIKLQEETGTKFLGFGLGKDSLDRTPNANATDAKINKWNDIKQKSSTQPKKPSKT